MDNFLLPKEATIVSRRQETEDTWTLSFVFKDPEHQKKYRFQPGQFNMVGLWGIGEAPISFSSPSSGEEAFLHTIRVVGSVTQSLIACRDGQTAWIRGPYGKAWP
ncbi:MAG: Ni/Fe hydrogenase subunit gamma, partial [Nitrospirae bacterium]|nr:Ni/Fe hydrogenase subunit gamma [Nitrospirota bacterium]